MIRSNLWSRIIPQDRRRETSSHVPIKVIATVLVLPIGLALGILLSHVLLVLNTRSVTGVLGALPSSSSLWGLVIGALSMALIIALRQYELAATVVVVVSLYLDWYLGMAFVAPILAVGLLLIFFLARSPQYPWAEPRALWLWALFLVLAILQTNRAPSVLYAADYYVGNIFSAFVMLWLGTVIARDTAHVRHFFQIISVFGALIAIHTIIEATTGKFIFESSRNAAATTVISTLDQAGNALHRAESFFLLPNTNGAFFALIFFIPLALFTMRSSFVWKIIFLTEMFVILLALLFTFSAGAWSSAFVGFIVFTALVGRTRYRIQSFLFLFAAGVVGIVSFPSQLSLLFQHASNPGELSLRTAVWQTGIRVIEAFPLTGLGIGRDVYLLGAGPYRVPAQYDVVNHPHNSYIEWAALGGLPVGIVFIALLSITVWLALRNWMQSDVENRPLLAGGVAAVTALSWYSLSDAGWTAAPLVAIGWLILGVVSSPLLMKNLHREMKADDGTTK